MSIDKKYKIIDDCPICNGSIKLTSEKVTIRYKGKELIIQEFFYKCDSCNCEFTTTEVDEINVETIEEAYKNYSNN